MTKNDKNSDIRATCTCADRDMVCPACIHETHRLMEAHHFRVQEAIHSAMDALRRIGA